MQEALTNTAKHGGTRRARVEITEASGRLTIEIRDDGQGFDPAERARGFGLVGMRERVELAGGTLEISSSQGAGTRVTATLPARHAEGPPGVQSHAEIA